MPAVATFQRASAVGPMLGIKEIKRLAGARPHAHPGGGWIDQ
jgi:hypothetical protein